MSRKMEIREESGTGVGQAVQFLPQPSQHPEFGEHGGVQCELQLGTHFGGLGAVDDLPPVGDSLTVDGWLVVGASLMTGSLFHVEV